MTNTILQNEDEPSSHFDLNEREKVLVKELVREYCERDVGSLIEVVSKVKNM